MAITEQVNLVERLIEKTKKGDLAWSESPEHGIYSISFKNYSLNIYIKTNRENSNDDVFIQIVDSFGELTEEFSDIDLSKISPNDWYNKMLDLYTSARRIALGADKALKDIISELDDDLPF